MGVHTDVYVVYYLYRSRYSFVADHCLKDGHHMVDLSDLENALKFPSESQARRFIAACSGPAGKRAVLCLRAFARRTAGILSGPV